MPRICETVVLFSELILSAEGWKRKTENPAYVNVSRTGVKGGT